MQLYIPLRLDLEAPATGLPKFKVTLSYTFESLTQKYSPQKIIIYKKNMIVYIYIPSKNQHTKHKFKCSHTHPLPLRFKFLHDVKEIIVDLRLTTKLQFHLVKIGQGVLHLGRDTFQRYKGQNFQQKIIHAQKRQ